VKDIRQKLLATFQVEHRDHVDQIRALLAAVEKSGQPEGSELEEIFRRAHSLKGAARAVDLRPVEGLAHHLETLFSRLRRGELAFNKDVSGAVESALNASEDCVAAIGGSGTPASFPAGLSALERVLGIGPEPDAFQAPSAEPSTVAVFQPLETIRITTQNFDGLLRSAGGLLMERQRQNEVTVLLGGILRQASELAREAESVRHTVGASVPRGGRLKLNVLMDSLQKQTRNLARSARTTRGLQQRSSWTMGRLGKQLQRDVWQARMVPAESLLEGYRKMMRDLARDASRQIEFRATSTGVHADRRVLEALKDPLMHLLRNSVSHGIEAGQERMAKGKPALGIVTLEIGSEGQRLTVAVSDDGKGVDLKRVGEVAVEQGVLSAADAAKASRYELAQILFRPGFSTSRAVTDLAGRGMGLSVVYETVRRLRGDVDVQPGDDAGVSLRLSVPLSIATHRLLLVTCANRHFAVPIHGIERLLRVRADSVGTVEGKPVVVFDGQPVSLFRLCDLLSLDSSPADILRVMILRAKGGRIAIAVDEFLWESETVIQDLGPAGRRDGRISGGILMDDGRVALVLEPAQLMAGASHVPIPDFLKPTSPAARTESFSILVVDDSMTTRTLEKSILEANGYQVRVAVDGVEALTQLRSKIPDLVITDVQMPRLDGFGLLEAMKADPALGRIPVIVVTSLDRREDQARGLELGADAYIVKRKFDQGELLAAIRQIL
jgi:two-component system, chemotaxis family, sensor kinase CheA